MSRRPLGQILQGLLLALFGNPVCDERRLSEDEQRVLYEEQWRRPPSTLPPRIDWLYWTGDHWRNRYGKRLSDQHIAASRGEACNSRDNRR